MGTEAEAEPARSVAARAGAGAGPGGPAEFTQPTRRSHRPAPRGNVAIT